MIRSVRRLLRCSRGTAAVEFAIVGGVLIALCVAILDFGRTFYAYNQLSFLADQATRKVLINPAISSGTLDSELRESLSAGDPNNLTIDIGSDTADGMNYRVVTIGFPMTLFIPGLESNAVSLSVSRRVPVE